MLFVRLFDLRLFGFVCFLFLLVSGKDAVCDCGTLWTFVLLFFFHITASVVFAYVFIKAYVVGTHLNSTDLLMQVK